MYQCAECGCYSFTEHQPENDILHCERCGSPTRQRLASSFTSKKIKQLKGVPDYYEDFKRIVDATADGDSDGFPFFVTKSNIEALTKLILESAVSHDDIRCPVCGWVCEEPDREEA